MSGKISRDIGMKLIIPCAGKGTRLYPHTLVTPKPLLSVAGEPVLGHIIKASMVPGLDEIVLVISPGSESIVEYVKNEFGQFKVTYVYQNEPLGLGHAVFTGIKDIKDGPIMIVLGDTIFSAPIDKYVSEGKDFILVHEVDDPRMFGVVKVENGEIVQMVEKPQYPISNLAIVGVYFITDVGLLYDALKNIIKSKKLTRGEYQLTDGLSLMLENGWRPVPVMADVWLDCGSHRSLLKTNRFLLDKKVKKIGVELIGTSVLIHPVYIGENCIVENSVIGPYVSLNDKAEVRNSVISNSIVNTDVKIINAVVKNSILSGKTKIEGKPIEVQLGNFSVVRI